MARQDGGRDRSHLGSTQYDSNVRALRLERFSDRHQRTDVPHVARETNDVWIPVQQSSDDHVIRRLPLELGNRDGLGRVTVLLNERRFEVEQRQRDEPMITVHRREADLHDRADGRVGAMDLTIESSIVVPDDVLFRKLGEEAVLLNLKTGMYFGLDPVGTRIWQLIVEHGTLTRVLDSMLTEYEVSRPVLEKDILDLCGQLCARGLGEISVRTTS